MEPMTDQPPPPDQFEHNAHEVRSVMREDLGVELDYDGSPVEWHEAYVERIRAETLAVQPVRDTG